MQTRRGQAVCPLQRPDRAMLLPIKVGDAIKQRHDDDVLNDNGDKMMIVVQSNIQVYGVLKEQI